MTVRKNMALAKLRAGKAVIGPMLNYASPDIAEWAAHLGFDYVWLDWQHGEYTEVPLNNAIARTRSGTASPLVRVKGNERGTINRVLDMGAMGVIVPMVETAGEAREAVDAAFYPPRGRRSAGGVRLGMLADGGEDYWYNANPEIMLVVMVESEAAIGRVREIMAVPGIDVVLIGPGDLMIDVKARGGDAARHETLVLEVAAASKATGVAAGYVCVTEAMAAKRIAQGFRFINYGLDHGIMMAGLKALKAEHEKLAWK